MSTTDPSLAAERFHRLVEIMAQLRGPEGCPWDRQQTFQTIKSYLLEETYEVLEAVDRQDWRALAEELGDLLLQVVFLAQMGAEQGFFTIADVLEAINEKLVRRHPHVFGGGEARTPEEVKRRWDQIKTEERRDQAGKEAGLLDSVPRALPALVEAYQISARAAAVGFDWENADQVLEKLHEELAELAVARQQARTDHLTEEIGDLLFVVVNLARFLRVDPEQALRHTNAKFRRRFACVEARLREQGRSPAEASLQEMEALWQQAKQD